MARSRKWLCHVSIHTVVVSSWAFLGNAASSSIPCQACNHGNLICTQFDAQHESENRYGYLLMLPFSRSGKHHTLYCNMPLPDSMWLKKKTHINFFSHTCAFNLQWGCWSNTTKIPDKPVPCQRTSSTASLCYSWCSTVPWSWSPSW